MENMMRFCMVPFACCSMSQLQSFEAVEFDEKIQTTAGKVNVSSCDKDTDKDMGRSNGKIPIDCTVQCKVGNSADVNNLDIVT